MSVEQAPRKPVPHPSATPFAIAWGLAIWEQRTTELRMTQQEFAELLGTTQAQVSQWETGRSAPGSSWQTKIVQKAQIPAKRLARIYAEAA